MADLLLLLLLLLPPPPNVEEFVSPSTTLEAVLTTAEDVKKDGFK